MSPTTTTKSVSFDTRLMSLGLHPVSASQTKSRVQQLDSHQTHITHDIKNHCAAVKMLHGLFCHVRDRAA